MFWDIKELVGRYVFGILKNWLGDMFLMDFTIFLLSKGNNLKQILQVRFLG